ncbi:MAG TPA: acyltransferase [Candidatus Dormibacteraeota bacterium]|jgi:acetyltransferase-like isoleucine patch superfamily enzyme|nr:acyltransferase [Candidatus Dormibacteraeota bacterium]
MSALAQLGKARQALWAQFSLRRCTEVAASVRLKGRVLVVGNGTIRLGPRVRLWGHPTPIELATMGDGELVIGEGTNLNRGVSICAQQSVRIGRNCGFGNDVLVMDTDFHHVGDHASLAADVAAPVTIGDNVWLASRSVILKGVTIGDGAVVCAGSVVVTDVAAGTVVGGSPARLIRRQQPPSPAPVPDLAGQARG